VRQSDDWRDAGRLGLAAGATETREKKSMETAMKMLSRMKVGLVAGTVVLALALPALAEGKEGKKKEEIKLSDCPAAVQQTIKDNAGSGEILEVEKSAKKGAVVYEAEVKKADGKKVDIKVAADGKLIEIEAAEDGDHQDKDEKGNKDKDDDDKDNDKE
jgi:hypothetical protein